ncbi:hypothetical protein ACLESD_37480 [Pyxidicoccus sp. 3LFB2]
MFRVLTSIILMCALLPRWALAQDTHTAVPPEDSLVAPPLVPAPEEVEPEATEPMAPDSVSGEAPEARGMPTAPRILLETLSGGAGMFVGGVGGLVIGIVATECSPFESDCSEAVIFALSGMAAGSALATWGAGSLMKGQGGFLSTLLGATLGTGAGLIAIAADPDGTLAPIALLTLPALGAMAGFELSRHLAPPSRFSLPGSQAPVAPVFGPTPRGGFMGGVAGRF